MTIVKEVTVEGIRYPVTVSDDNEALLAAAAAGRAIIGIWDPSVRPLGAGFDACLYDRARREDYIDNQYRFHECGLWALVLKKSGLIIGKAGITAGELGYHIYGPFRGRGYAFEACSAILGYAEEELGLRHVRIKTGEGNEASVRLAEALGFSRTEDTEQKSEGILTFEKYMQTDMR